MLSNSMAMNATSVTVALAGQPNTGKSTLFNRLTGARQHVGNWPGKTVEQKSRRFDHSETKQALQWSALPPGIQAANPMGDLGRLPHSPAAWYPRRLYPQKGSLFKKGERQWSRHRAHRREAPGGGQVAHSAF
nr:FeoB small GTPase domain-containing protein [uncultured Desulfobacter sp.]